MSCADSCNHQHKCMAGEGREDLGGQEFYFEFRLAEKLVVICISLQIIRQNLKSIPARMRVCL